jgi:predicted amidohydrolase
MSAFHTVAAIQMVSSHEVAHNLQQAEKLIEQAAQQGARLVLLPEYFCLMGHSEYDKLHIAEPLGMGPLQTFLSEQAKKYQIWLCGGTIPIKDTQHTHQVYNTLLVYNPQGERVARYDKIHLFCFKNGGEVYDEGRTLLAGNQAVAIDIPSIGRVGMSICYDLRFPELYRSLSFPQPCQLMLVCAAFTQTTGRAHWEVLLRARAIENQCYVLAAAQGGEHTNGRKTFGHSMLISPWGEIKTFQDEGEGVIVGQINTTQITRVREQLPALQHRRQDWTS